MHALSNARHRCAINTATLGFQAPIEAVTTELAAISSVKKVTSEILEDGWVHFIFWSDSGTDTRFCIHKLCMEQKWPLRSLVRHEAKLEDVFVELTRKD